MPEIIELSPTELRVLAAPDRIARAAAGLAPDARGRWMLRLPREVRRSFIEHVLEAGGGRPEAQERWLLLADEATRRSYVRAVLDETD